MLRNFGSVIGLSIVALASACSESASEEVDAGGRPDANRDRGEDATVVGQDASASGRDAGGGSIGDAGTPGGLTALSDDFEGSSIDPSWAFLNPQLVTASQASGALELRITQHTLWYNRSQGVLVYKTVTGNFKVSAIVHARRLSDPAEPPTNPIHLGGIMARNPVGEGSGGTENYVFIVAGRDQNDISVETKSTTNSNSQFDGPTWASGDAELRMCRIGSTFLLYKREIGATVWEQAASYLRTDLPPALQVGPNAYAAGGSNGSPDFLARFDQITFDDVADQAGCEAN